MSMDFTIFAETHTMNRRFLVKITRDAPTGAPLAAFVPYSAMSSSRRSYSNRLSPTTQTPRSRSSAAAVPQPSVRVPEKLPS